MKNPNLQAIRVSGDDAPTFLQGQCTCDIRAIDSVPLLAACCNQKGRMVANFFISRHQHDFYLVLPESMVAILLDHLQHYAIFSKVTFEVEAAPPTPVDQRNRPIWIFAPTSAQFTPQMIDLEKQGGVSFTKGCYLGQEVIARTQHLGRLKRHLYHITLNNMAPLNIGGDITNSNGQKMGTVVAIAKPGKSAFAVVEDRAIEQPLFYQQAEIIQLTRPSISG